MTVYVTRGRKYHLDSTCPRMTSGEDLWDGDSEDWWHTSGSYRREVDTPNTAAYLGKLPCLHCVPAEQRAFPPLYGQTFGHEAMDVITNGKLRTVECFRCLGVAWPCTSAVILGLAATA